MYLYILQIMEHNSIHLNIHHTNFISIYSVLWSGVGKRPEPYPGSSEEVDGDFMKEESDDSTEQ